MSKTSQGFTLSETLTKKRINFYLLALSSSAKSSASRFSLGASNGVCNWLWLVALALPLFCKEELMSLSLSLVFDHKTNISILHAKPKAPYYR